MMHPNAQSFYPNGGEFVYNPANQAPMYGYDSGYYQAVAHDDQNSDNPFDRELPNGHQGFMRNGSRGRFPGRKGRAGKFNGGNRGPSDSAHGVNGGHGFNGGPPVRRNFSDNNGHGHNSGQPFNGGFPQGPATSNTGHAYGGAHANGLPPRPDFPTLGGFSPDTNDFNTEPGMVMPYNWPTMSPGATLPNNVPPFVQQTDGNPNERFRGQVTPYLCPSPNIGSSEANKTPPRHITPAIHAPIPKRATTTLPKTFTEAANTTTPRIPVSAVPTPALAGGALKVIKGRLPGGTRAASAEERAASAAPPNINKSKGEKNTEEKRSDTSAKRTGRDVFAQLAALPTMTRAGMQGPLDGAKAECDIQSAVLIEKRETALTNLGHAGKAERVEENNVTVFQEQAIRSIQKATMHSGEMKDRYLAQAAKYMNDAAVHSKAARKHCKTANACRDALNQINDEAVWMLESFYRTLHEEVTRALRSPAAPPMDENDPDLQELRAYQRIFGSDDPDAEKKWKEHCEARAAVKAKHMGDTGKGEDQAGPAQKDEQDSAGMATQPSNSSTKTDQGAKMENNKERVGAGVQQTVEQYKVEQAVKGNKFETGGTTVHVQQHGVDGRHADGAPKKTGKKRNNNKKKASLDSRASTPTPKSDATNDTAKDTVKDIRKRNKGHWKGLHSRASSTAQKSDTAWNTQDQGKEGVHPRAFSTMPKNETVKKPQDPTKGQSKGTAHSRHSSTAPPNGANKDNSGRKKGSVDTKGSSNAPKSDITKDAKAPTKVQTTTADIGFKVLDLSGH